jgi:adenylate cyclase
LGNDRRELVELLEVFLLGSAPTLSGEDIAARTGIDLETAKARWRSLGFSNPADDEVAFTEADLEAMQLTERLHELGFIDPDDEAALIRTLGRSFARLAEWQVELIGRTVDIDTASVEELVDLATEVAPLIEKVMSYAWRRHMVSVGTRKLLAPESSVDGEEETDEDEDEAGDVAAVGFADIVNYTRQSQRLTRKELADLIEDFESKAQAIVADHGGQIIKTIGDEVLFVAESPVAAAHIALELTECHLRDETFPELRVGLAYGPVLARLGDVFGSVVNLASRLTSTARPGRVVADAALAAALEDDDDFRLRKMRRTSVKGYRRIEPWSLKRPAESNPHLEPDNQPGPASTFIAEQAKGLLRAVGELDEPRPVAEKPLE